MARLKVTAIEPYLGGSHRLFLEVLKSHPACDFEILSLPPRMWKWRMRLSAPFFAGQVSRLTEPPDLFLCSSFVDVAAFRGLLPLSLAQVPIRTYFHENQFAYPMRVDEERDAHFGLTNLTTALASDSVAFNSSYNLESFLTGCRDLLKKAADMTLPGFEETIRAKSRVLYPALDFTDIDSAPAEKRSARPVIVWNHRWEHDKNPELFFAALFSLQEQGVDFEVVVLGESFRDRPSIFEQARLRLGERLVQFGFAPDRAQYVGWLKKGDIVVSAANHEFFGIAMIEAVRAGCRPLMPARLSYPEFFDEEFFYRQDSDLIDKLATALLGGRLKDAEARALTEKFSWTALDSKYFDWFEGKNH